MVYLLQQLHIVNRALRQRFGIRLDLDIFDVAVGKDVDRTLSFENQHLLAYNTFERALHQMVGNLLIRKSETDVGSIGAIDGDPSRLAHFPPLRLFFG